MSDELTVIYVPPTIGSEIRVWKAEMPPNWMVLQSRLCQSVRNDISKELYLANDWKMVRITSDAKKPVEMGG